MQQPRVQIDVEKAVRRRSRQRTHLTIVLVVLLCLLGVLGMVARSTWQANDDSPVAVPKVAEPSPDTGGALPAAEAVDSQDDADREHLIEDDGRTMWASPTEGEPIDLGWLPPGCQVFAALRPAALLSHAEGEKVLTAVGPTGRLGIASIERATGMRFDAIEQLVVGLRATPKGVWTAAYVVRPIDSELIDEVISNLSPIQPSEHENSQYVISGEQAYYVASTANEPQLVITPAADMVDVIDLAGAAPPMRRDMEQLVAASDADRHLTLLLAPNYLAADGRSVFEGIGQRLQAPLAWLFGEGLTAVSLSLNWGDDFFVELLAASTIDTHADRLARQLSQRVEKVPARVEEHVFDLQLEPYGRRLLARFPEMLRAAVRYTRHGYENDHAVIRTYLPVAAGHNLLMASELALVEPMDTATDSARESTVRGESVEERLARITSLSFSRDTLEAALEMLATDISVEIELAGQDLQQEGITKNQSFGIDLHDRPAAEILVEILRLANPDKAATALDDLRQKLVYVIRADPPGILVTTRTAAERRGDTLPAVFGRP